MGCLGVVDTNIQAVVGISGFIALPVGTFYQMVRFIVYIFAGFLLAGFRNAISTLVVAVGIAFIALLAAYQLVQLVVLIVGLDILFLFVNQVAESVVGIGACPLSLCDSDPEVCCRRY